MAFKSASSRRNFLLVQAVFVSAHKETVRFPSGTING